MNSRKLLAALVFSSFASAAPAAFADSGMAPADPTAKVDSWFAQYDKNKDEKITLSEFRLGRTFFNSLDLDADGSLTREEAKKAISMHPAPVDLTKLDTDQDGYVSRREWTGDQAGFDKLDRDNDGVISKIDEAITRDESRAKKRLKTLDKNGDDLVQRNEWPANDESFRNQDLNRNGTLSVDELGDRHRRQ